MAEIEYLEKFLAVAGGLEDDLGLIPGQYDKIVDAFTARRELVLEYSWAVPNEHALQRLLELGPIVEVGAGGGYWAMLLREMGADVVAYDTAPPGGARENIQAQRLWTKVKRGHAHWAGRHPDRALFLCWPPYNRPMAAIALEAYLRAGGTTLAYIGEGPGAATGDDDFHEMIAARMQQVDYASLHQWPGIRDYLTIYRILDPGKEKA